MTLKTSQNEAAYATSEAYAFSTDGPMPADAAHAAGPCPAVAVIGGRPDSCAPKGQPKAQRLRSVATPWLG